MSRGGTSGDPRRRPVSRLARPAGDRSRRLRRRPTSTSANFHDRRHPLPERPAPSKVLASVATLGGGAMGFEGPSIYMGTSSGPSSNSAFGASSTRGRQGPLHGGGRRRGGVRHFQDAGAGAIFVLEVPYQRDVAARACSRPSWPRAASYLTFVAVWGTTPIWPATGLRPSISLRARPPAPCGHLRGARCWWILDPDLARPSSRASSEAVAATPRRSRRAGWCREPGLRGHASARAGLSTIAARVAEPRPRPAPRSSHCGRWRRPSRSPAGVRAGCSFPSSSKVLSSGDSLVTSPTCTWRACFHSSEQPLSSVPAIGH